MIRKNLHIWLVCAIAFAGCNPYAIAWRSTAGVRSAATVTDETIANIHKLKRENCQDESDPKACLLASKQHEALKVWRNYAKPAINASLVLTVTSLTVAERNKDDIDWIAMLRPAFCAVSGALSKFGHLFPPSFQKQALAALAMVKGVSCE